MTNLFNIDKPEKKKKRGIESLNLTRPIICICNDQ
jgi:hypothetical protein